MPPARTAEIETNPTSKPSMLLAKRIKALRDERGWTLDVTSEHTGLSRSALSKIERQQMSPTYNALNKLAQGFGIGMMQLMEGRTPEKSEDVKLTRSDEGSMHSTSLYLLRFLDAGLYANSPLIVTEFTIEATDISQFEQWDRHDDENFVYVLEGTALFHREGSDEPLKIGKGDSICFDARIGHAFTSPTGKPARALSVTIRM
ncbi:cupin domain-containing protein [Mesorhizobium sp. BH1-1-5]|uniref:helix-turn-helix domain-containing protein n=2 Tax=unclassified Mesorhizobium TaxID=325217 RepID=UPI001127827E|nr:cupin domain-containing protein [Mesorhizobium sp. B2-7-1]MBZ9991542.1 cupin domain-containing protein [Mesorhizobium sp. BH1-1-5]TPJ74589.1 helix-turn-helix domain-containing protein [Mesorhizobium sp. B2-7-1]